MQKKYYLYPKELVAYAICKNWGNVGRQFFPQDLAAYTRPVRENNPENIDVLVNTADIYDFFRFMRDEQLLTPHATLTKSGLTYCREVMAEIDSNVILTLENALPYQNI